MEFSSMNNLGKNMLVAFVSLFLFMGLFSYVTTLRRTQEIRTPLIPLSRDTDIEEYKTPAPTEVPETPSIKKRTQVQAPAYNTYAIDSLSTIIEEAGYNLESKNSDWWVNSGGYFFIENGIGKTVSGKLSPTNSWRLKYNASSPLDTDNGYHPQNIFRLISQSSWTNFEQSMYFRVTADNISPSPNRAAHNGVLFLNRYKDSNNLYYTGIRVDGQAVIKKKLKGTYYTLALSSLFPGIYERSSNPNLIPKNTWIGIKTLIFDNSDGTVHIHLYTDINRTGSWTLIAKAIDDGTLGAPLYGEHAHAGIRTDFMDVEFDEYLIEKRN